MPLAVNGTMIWQLAGKDEGNAHATAGAEATRAPRPALRGQRGRYRRTAGLTRCGVHPAGRVQGWAGVQAAGRGCGALVTVWFTPHISTLRIGSLARNSFTFWHTKCFFFVLVLLALSGATATAVVLVQLDDMPGAAAAAAAARGGGGDSAQASGPRPPGPIPPAASPRHGRARPVTSPPLWAVVPSARAPPPAGPAPPRARHPARRPGPPSAGSTARPSCARA